MRVLFLTHGFNSLAQRLYVELTARGHEVSVEFDVHDRLTEEAVALFRPDVVLAPFLKRAIPESVWTGVRCLVVHPGIIGDRGPSSLDWAIQEGEREWGVTVLQANGEMDAGDIRASVNFPMRGADSLEEIPTKASLYRNEVTEAAVEAVLLALERLRDPSSRPQTLDYSDINVRGRPRPPMKQADRAIDWSRDSTATILRKICAADGVPGVLDELLGQPVYVHDAHVDAGAFDGAPGALIARREGAVLRAAIDGAVWIGHLRMRTDDGVSAKLPAVTVLGERVLALPEISTPLWDPRGAATYRELRYEERGDVGYLHFAFYNGAMSTSRCKRLAEAIRFAKSRPTRVLVLMGGPDFWSNGIDLNAIEASDASADESWANINAIDDVTREVLDCDRQMTVAALQGNAGAGGVFLALAADRVLARRGVVFNPHYRNMGNLYGSEYWTYLLPKRIGAEHAQALMQSRLPLGAPEARAMGLIDEAVGGNRAEFIAFVEQEAESLASTKDFARVLDAKRAARAADESAKPLARYRAEELERMSLNFYGFDPSYHVARYNFVFKVPRSRTPLHLARHRVPSAASERGVLA